MLTCIAVLLIYCILIKDFYLFPFKKFVCIIKFHIFVKLKILLRFLLISDSDGFVPVTNRIVRIYRLMKNNTADISFILSR